MPYAKSLRIECEEGPEGAKVYYQISESALPRGTPVETFAQLHSRDRLTVSCCDTARTVVRLGPIS